MSGRDEREPFLPGAALTMAGARMQLSAWHFAKETLTTRESQLLYVAEALMHELDRIHGGYARTALTDEETHVLARALKRARSRGRGRQR